MSYNFHAVGRNKEKLKEEVRKQQCQDPVNAPHNGVPVWVADHLCAEIDRCRIYDWSGRTYGLSVLAHGSFHEQGGNDTFEVKSVQLVE